MKNFLYKLYIVFLFLIIFFLTILFRLFRSKEEILLETFIGNISKVTLFLYIFFGLLQLITILILLRYFYKNYYHINNQSRIINYFSKYFRIFYKEPMEYVYEKFSNYMPGILFINIVKYIDKERSPIVKKIIETLYYNSVWVFYFFPQIFCSFLFLYEIVFYNKIHYFFYAIIFLVISLIYDLFINLGITFAEKSYPGFLEFIDIEGFDINNKGVYTNFKFSWKPKYSYAVIKIS